MWIIQWIILVFVVIIGIGTIIGIMRWNHQYKRLENDKLDLINQTATHTNEMTELKSK